MRNPKTQKFQNQRKINVLWEDVKKIPLIVGFFNKWTNYYIT